MPELLSATLALAITTTAFRPRNTAAVSAEAVFASNQAMAAWERFEKTYSLKSPHGDLISELEMVAAEHSLPGWDGNLAPAVSFSTVSNARDFVRALPDGIPSPEIAVDPDDAAISFEWHGGYRQVFSVSLGESGRLACAGLDGTDQWHAALGFENEIPAFVLDGIRRVTE